MCCCCRYLKKKYLEESYLPLFSFKSVKRTYKILVLVENKLYLQGRYMCVNILYALRHTQYKQYDDIRYWLQEVDSCVGLTHTYNKELVFSYYTTYKRHQQVCYKIFNKATIKNVFQSTSNSCTFTFTLLLIFYVLLSYIC